jgi:flap endonuclease-1
MTIKGLADFIKKAFPYARRRVPVEFFQNRRIAIDGHLLSYAYMSTAIGKEAKKLTNARKIEVNQKLVTTSWLGRWLNTITRLKEARLIPVVVFDGPDVPPEKTATRARRQAGKENVREEVEKLRLQIAAEDLEVDMEARERLVKLLARDIRVTAEQLANLRKILILAGVSVLQATGEGEALCASLVKDGDCYATFTQDSDMGAYLSPRVIISVDEPIFTCDGQRVQMCEVIYYQQVMKQLKLNEVQFVDFCIMCGSDYNDNVPNIGPSKSYKLIQEYGTLDAIPPEKYKKELLNYVRVREIFASHAVPAEGDPKTSPVPQPAELSQLLAATDLLRPGGRLLSLVGASARPVLASAAPNYDDAELL